MAADRTGICADAAEVPIKMIITSDLHLTDRESDFYRFEFLNWLTRTQYTLSNSHLLILGDITDNKDHHSSWLVNAIVHALLYLRQHYEKITILRGNHDTTTESSTAFFSFLSYIEGIEFIDSPKVYHSLLKDGDRCLFIPHQRDFITQWDELSRSPDMDDLSEIDYLFVHQTLTGSVAESGQEMTGVPLSVFPLYGFAGKIISGDVHVPQEVGPATYVGAPYPIRFGDEFSPRVLMLRCQSHPNTSHWGEVVTHSVSVPTIQKRHRVIESVEEFEQADLHERDQVKVTFVLQQHDYENWIEYRRRIDAIAEQRGVKLRSVDFVLPQQKNETSEDGSQHPTSTIATQSAANVLEQYAAKERISEDLLEQGKKFL
jgi:DNA repair exonuclease SbcCD nuclease subunit